MTTTDTDALTERIARAAATSEGFGPDHPDHEVVVGEYLSDAQFLAPFIADEVRKAKAEALREASERAGRDLGWANGGHTSTYSVRHWLRELAAEHETGDSDERR